MEPRDRWDYLTRLDEEMLRGGVLLSEWTSFLMRDADEAFVSGANLASLLTAMSAIETHLRGEHSDKSCRLVDLIAASDFAPDLKQELHDLRRYRNRWVHVSDPWDDDGLLTNPEQHEAELESIARRALVALRKVAYSDPWI
ncbi:hypothetical protein DB347_10620 [Opitutaceae bacterium EW11]|nr:hypothetical protein DB347_10620 [Opitutaceae bacterium EW11]